MALIRKKKKYVEINPRRADELRERRAQIPDGLAERCPKCQAIIFQNSIESDYLCPKCNYHLQFPALKRIEWLVDEGSFREWDSELTAQDPLNFPGYQEKLDRSQSSTELKEAVVTGQAKLGDLPFALGVMDSRFVMASMGTVVGEKLTRLFEQATEKKLPVVL